MIGLRVEGRETFLDLQIAGRRLDETIRTTIRETAREYQGRVKAMLSRPGSGKQYGARKGRRVYKRARRKTVVFGQAASYRTVVKVERRTRAYTASAPGQPPAQFTGTLFRSVRVKFPSRQKGYGAKVYADKGTAFYRHFLEFGTAPRVQRRWRGKTVNRAVGRVAPRPVFSPLQARLSEDLERRILRATDLFIAFRG